MQCVYIETSLEREASRLLCPGTLADARSKNKDTTTHHSVGRSGFSTCGCEKQKSTLRTAATANRSHVRSGPPQGRRLQAQGILILAGPSARMPMNQRTPETRPCVCLPLVVIPSIRGTPRRLAIQERVRRCIAYAHASNVIIFVEDERLHMRHPQSGE